MGRSARRLRGCVAAGLVASASSPAAADSGGADAPDTAELRELSRAPSGYARILASVMVGRGLRFNNPYRLRTELGDGGESLSLTDSYVDLGAAIAFGRPDGIQHGGALRFSIALSGVAQSVLTPSYLVAYRGPTRVLVYGRIGAPILISPDSNVGGELAAGAAYFVTAGLGISTELGGDLFYGAATREATYTVYPILSAQLGIVVDYEVLP